MQSYEQQRNLLKLFASVTLHLQDAALRNLHVAASCLSGWYY